MGTLLLVLHHVVTGYDTIYRLADAAHEPHMWELRSSTVVVTGDDTIYRLAHEPHRWELCSSFCPTS